MLDFETSAEVSNILVRNYYNLTSTKRIYFFLKNYVTPEGAVSHNVVYYQQLSIARYQVSFYSKIGFE